MGVSWVQSGSVEVAVGQTDRMCRGAVLHRGGGGRDDRLWRHVAGDDRDADRDARLRARIFKAWSQNFGHDHVDTTLTAYGEVSRARQAEIMRLLADPNAHGNGSDEARKLLETALALSLRRPACA
jgi:hypothetical protein